MQSANCSRDYSWGWKWVLHIFVWLFYIVRNLCHLVLWSNIDNKAFILQPSANIMVFFYFIFLYKSPITRPPLTRPKPLNVRGYRSPLTRSPLTRSPLTRSPLTRPKPLNIGVTGHFSNRNLLTLHLNAVRSSSSGKHSLLREFQKAAVWGKTWKVCGDFNDHNTEWLLHSFTTDVAGLFCQEFAMAQFITQIVDFPNHIPDRDDHQPYLALLLLILLWENLIWSL